VDEKFREEKQGFREEKQGFREVFRFLGDFRLSIALSLTRRQRPEKRRDARYSTPAAAT
jgi:hypothetical protein